MALRILTAISPSLASRLLTRVWFTPPRAPLRADARARLTEGTSLSLALDGRRFAAWSFGSGPAVLLVHGWGGHAGQLVGFIAPLVERGYRVVTFDALGHGQSSNSALGRRQGSFVEVAAVMRVIVDAVGPIHAVVAHSGGAISTGIALSNGLGVGRVVLLAPMTRPSLYAERFGRWLGLGVALGDAWQQRAGERVGFRWADLDLHTAADRFTPPPVLVVHDRGDKEVPLADGQAVADSWPEASMVETTGLGHRRILHDAAVIARVAEFIAP
ncbi:MAG: alpha/beta fold hydrolase [Deltaproteobacteria bacterium]|nr:alpha/beta fold hydrolase [Nannocystaceae bacterium]